MIVNCDVRGLEVVAAANLSGDTILIQELWDFHNGLSELDTHARNQKDFNLPSRHIAKIFKFRLIYGGQAYSYAHDPDFMGVSTSEKFWQQVIDAYYTKYKGIKKWHDGMVQEVMRTGVIEIPSGRYFQFKPTRDWRGGLKWPITTIKNYPVQGFGADLVKLARIKAVKDVRDSGLEALFIGTVHDSLKFDTPEKNVYNISMICRNAVEAVPALVKQHWDYSFDLPLTCEIKVGPNQRDMVEI